MSHLTEALGELAKEYSVRSPAALLKLARKVGAPATLAECRAALATNVPAQTLAPAPRSEGRSAAEGPGSRLQADLMDFNQNADGSENNEHKYALQVSDVFTRKAYTEPLKGKSAVQVDSAMRKILREVPGQGRNAVVSTDQGGEFAGLDGVLGPHAAHREKQGVNDLAVVDRTMQTLKKDLEDKAQNYGTGWAHNLAEVTRNYNFRPNAAVHGSPDTAGDEGPQQFFILQDQSANFQHNRHLTLRRQAAVKKAGAYREPIENGGRSFKPNYGEVHQFRRFLRGGDVEDRRGGHALLKEVRAVSAASAEPLAHITFPPRQGKPRRKPAVGEAGERRTSVVGPEESEVRQPDVGGGSHVPPAPPEAPAVSAAAAGGAAAAAAFSAAQLRRQDAVSRRIMDYQPKVTEEERREKAAAKAAAAAAKEQAQRERIAKAAATEAEKQRKQLERMMKKR